MTYLRNDHADMEIGYQQVSNSYMIYIQKANVLRYYGKFNDKKKAEQFLEDLKIWDAAGGNDGETNRID